MRLQTMAPPTRWHGQQLHMRNGRVRAEAKRGQFQSIQNIEPGVSVSVFTSAPVCSKTRAYLNKKGIELMDLDELILPE